MVSIGQQFGSGVVAEFTGSEGVEASDPSEDSTLVGKFFVDEAADGSQGNEPGSLDEVHLLE